MIPPSYCLAHILYSAMSVISTYYLLTPFRLSECRTLAVACNAKNEGHVWDVHKMARVPNPQTQRQEWNCHGNPGRKQISDAPSGSRVHLHLILNLITRSEQPQRKGCQHENKQGPGQVLGGRCDFRTSPVSHLPKSVIESVIWRLRFVTCPGKNCDLPRVVLQKLWFAAVHPGQVSARKVWFGLWFELRNHNTWLETKAKPVNEADVTPS